MSKLAKKLYIELSTALSELQDPPICSEPQYQDWFFPDGLIPTKGMSTAAHMSRVRLMEVQAKRLCAECPVKALCAEYAVVAHEPYGIWGGLTPADRSAIYASAKESRLANSEAR